MMSSKLNPRVRIYLVVFSKLSRLPDMPNLLNRMISWFSAIWQAIWLGLMDTNTLNELTWFYYSRETGFESKEFNINHGFWPWEAEAIQEHFVNKKCILVAGAGGGREVIALAQLGYRVTGIDFSSSLVDACCRNAQEAGVPVDVLLSPPGDLPSGLGIYDALLIGRGFFHHIPSSARRIAFLAHCHHHLKQDAPVILSDFFTRNDDSRFYSLTQAIGNKIRKVRNQSETVELGDWLTETFQHAFTAEEIQNELLSSGFFPEVYRVSPAGEATHLAHILARVQ
jgi:2-polyprenyl-3-methyl-5-hydroxy-6-metoxy-1,4-benzoquinol methylase